MPLAVEPAPEAHEHFACFGGTCAVLVMGGARGRTATAAATEARAHLLAWHARFSRFEPGSELVRLNEDPRARVPVSALMARLAEAVAWAGSLTGGLVDATLIEQIERAGYATHFDTASVPLAEALARAPARAAGGPRPGAHWGSIAVDREAGTVTRPPGVRIDSGGLAKGLFADVLAGLLGEHDSFAVDCAGDLRLGGRAGLERRVEVRSPFGEDVLHAFSRREGGIATSGIGKRSWLDADGRPAHHVLDPASGRPAFTGVVQATALAPTALEAEVRTKAALLAGPQGAERWLVHGGVVVLDDASHRVIEPPTGFTLPGGQRVRLRPPGR